MYEEPYRTCPICRNRLEPIKLLDYYKQDGQVWRVYSCPTTCKSEVWVVPFKGLFEHKR
jgi:hypothetical protein